MATVKWLLLFPALVLIASDPLVLTVGADSPQMSIQVCRANVEPCQREVSIPENGAVGLNIVLVQEGVDPGSVPPKIVAWEAHLRLSGGSVAGLAQTPSGPPVQERGTSGLALDGLHPLEDGGQYFTVQNQYDAGSGRLDYAVTLVRFDPAKPPSRSLPIPVTPRLNLGRITVVGTNRGNLSILPEGSVAQPFQVVVFNSSGDLSSVSPAAPSGGLATVKVGDVATPELRGRLVGQPPIGGAPAHIPKELTITFWDAGAVPPWQGGSAQPVGTFRKVPTDSQGAFRVTDIAPSILPPGTYDLRVKGPGTLASLVPGVTVPAPGSPGAPPVTTVSLGGLREGDLDGNNAVDRMDLLVLKASFGKVDGSAGFNPSANFNGDLVVDVLDFARLARNFGKRGD